RASVARAPPRSPPSDRPLHRRHRRVTLADHGVDPRAPHRVPAIEIPWGHRLKLAIDAERFIALALARRDDAEKAEERQVIRQVTRDGGEPPQAGGIACLDRLLLHESF